MGDVKVFDEVVVIGDVCFDGSFGIWCGLFLVRLRSRSLRLNKILLRQNQGSTGIPAKSRSRSKLASLPGSRSRSKS